MAAIVYQTNKKTGFTNAYESIAYWDKKKRQSRAKRKCIGKLDPQTQQIIPTRKRQLPVVSRNHKRGPVPITRTKRSFYGATYLFDRIGEDTGMTEDLETCFGESFRQILSIAYYLVMEDRNPLSRFNHWAAIHWHPHGGAISSQRSSELFASLTEEARQRFFQLQAKRRMYLHLYYSPERALEDEMAFNSRLAHCQKELERGQRHPEHDKQYAKYFEVKSTPVRGTKVVAKEEALTEAKRNYGYFALLSNDIKEPIEALEIYRNKDLVEKAFDNLKERLNLRRLAVSSKQSLDGKIFVQFIALVSLSYITKKMQENKLFKNHALHAILDEFDIIGCFEAPGQRLQIGEITKRQMDLYTTFGVRPPASLQ